MFTVYSLRFTEMMWGYEKTVAESGVNLQPFFLSCVSRVA